MRTRFSVRAAVAAHLDEDASDTEDNRRYQPTRTPCPVYTVGNDYLTATNRKRKPKGDKRYRWIRIETGPFNKAVGWQVWRAAREDEE